MRNDKNGDQSSSDAIQRLIETDTKVEKSDVLGDKPPRKKRTPLLGIGISVAVVAVLVVVYLVTLRPGAAGDEAGEPGQAVAQEQSADAAPIAPEPESPEADEQADAGPEEVASADETATGDDAAGGGGGGSGDGSAEGGGTAVARAETPEERAPAAPADSQAEPPDADAAPAEADAGDSATGPEAPGDEVAEGTEDGGTEDGSTEDGGTDEAGEEPATEVAQAEPALPDNGPEAREDEIAGRITSLFRRREVPPPDEPTEPEEEPQQVVQEPESPEEAEQPGWKELTELVPVSARTVRFGAVPTDEIALDNERPRVEVEVAPFRIEEHEVTNRQYKIFLDDTGYEPVPTSDDPSRSDYNWDPETRTYPDGQGDYPVVNITREDARAYADWAGRRLPTEVEWEAVARAGAEGDLYPWGNSFPDRVFANFDSQALVPVGRYQPNDLGIYDLAGNAFEWVEDAYVPGIHDSFSTEAYPPTEGEEGVLKGGAFYSTFREIRISYRENNFPDVRFFGYGFRLAADAKQP